jgi:hypothetical protein
VSSTLCDSAWISSMVSNRYPFSFNFIFGNRKKPQGAKSKEFSGWGMFHQKLLLLLVSCQDPEHKFGCNMVHAQFFRQNPSACTITNSHLLSNVMNGPMLILTDELLNLCNRFRSCAASGSPCVFVIVNWCATGLEPGMPLKHLCTTLDLVPKGLMNHCEVLCSTFPRIGTKFDAHLLFLSLIHCENHHRSCTWPQINPCESCPYPPSYVQLGTLTHRTW